MSKKVSRRDGRPQEEPPGFDVLRAIAGYPASQGHVGATGIRSSVTHIQRDHNGRVLGSTERIEETLIANVDLDWRN